MKKTLLSLVVSGFLIGAIANENDIEVENKVLKERLNSLVNTSNKRDININSKVNIEKSLNEFTKNTINKRNFTDYNPNKNVMEKILGKYKVNYKIGSSYSEKYLIINKTELSDEYGYENMGTHGFYETSDNLLLCRYDNKESTGYDYICLGNSSLGNDYTSWYYFNLNENSINGKYYIGNGNNAAKAMTYGIDYTMTGTKLENYNDTVTINSDYIYTSEDMNNAKSTQKEECKTNPESCGIEIVECKDNNIDTTFITTATPPTLPSTTNDLTNIKDVDVKFLTKDEFDNLGSGWHLIGTGATINDISIFGESKNTIWTFENNSWIKDVREIKPLQGFWIKK